MRNALGVLAAATLLTVANPTTGLSQTTAQTKTSINNCLNSEPLIKQMHDKIIMKNKKYKTQEQGRTEELCQIMALARKSYTKEGVDFLIKHGMKDLEDGSELMFIIFLALLDQNGVTESGRDCNKLCKTDKDYMDLYKTMKKAFELHMLVKADEKALNAAEKGGK